MIESDFTNQGVYFIESGLKNTYKLYTLFWQICNKQILLKVWK